MDRFYFLVLTMLFVFAAAPYAPLHAQLSPNTDAPIQIEADETIEWLRDQKQYIARGNAVAVQKDYTVKADELIADYTQNDAGKTTVWQFTAKGSVEMTTGDYQAFGEKAVYHVENQHTTLTGGDLKIISGNNTLTAQDKIEYFGTDNKVIARGRPRAEYAQGTDKKVIEADIMHGYFTKNAQGNLQLSRVDASGNVVIVTQAEVLKGDKATYRLAQEQAELSGNVKITRGSNQLNGDRAVLDMVKGTSTLMATNQDGAPKKRVQGLFFLGGNDTN